ncbi:hypothetical protein EV127DRAFT_115878 [Xylaria flabelliformis]|nr:hypothetical protein EV127DRAFT_115878 [Xylaria flabelliformis]
MLAYARGWLHFSSWCVVHLQHAVCGHVDGTDLDHHYLSWTNGTIGIYRIGSFWHSAALLQIRYALGRLMIIWSVL